MTTASVLRRGRVVVLLALVVASIAGGQASHASTGAAEAAAPAARGATPATVPAGFADTVALSGLTLPTDVAFSADGRVFVGEKSGLVKVFDSLSDTTPTVFADLRTQVHNYWDRGLLGLALDPEFPSRPYVYVAYTHDAEPGGTAPRWGSAGATSDGCPDPPGGNSDGCLVQARLSRLTASGDRMTGSEHVLVTDWCQQFPSHSVGTVGFGPDGALYVSAGDGASFNYVDYGQTKNPCGDPPAPAGTSLTPPTAEGGSLRSQSVRRTGGQPVGLDGTIIRVDPVTGAGLPDNPFASSPDANARRIIAYGMRNPFRFGFRPGTDEIWVGDVGWRTWEEINRVADVDDGVAENFGWPCYEGTARQGGYDAANLNRCESLYSGGGQRAPFYTYRHDVDITPADTCDTGNSSVGGIAFEEGSNYPASYRGALFFADASRYCIWVMKRGSGPDPSPSQIQLFASGRRPVRLATGPGGDLFYVDIEGGELRRIVYTGANHLPTAVVAADPASGEAPLTVDFDGTGSHDLDGDPLQYAWDLDGDGQFDDSTAVSPTRTYTSNGAVTAALRVTDPSGASDTASVTVTVGPPNSPPVPVIDTPTSELRWRVGQQIQFSGHATDAQEGDLPASRLTWSVLVNHCPNSCHTHPLQDFVGVSAGSLPAPDHEYPSSLTLVLRATDSAGATASTTRELDPQTVDLTFATDPSGLDLGIGADVVEAPATRRVIVGSSNSVSAPGPQSLGGESYVFGSWSDGGAATHNIVAPATPTTYTARYVEQRDALFVDVLGNHPFYDDIAWMVDNGITTGYSDGTFRGTAPVTRQAMAAFLYRAAGAPNGADPTCDSAPFVDVSVSHPFCGEIAWMADEGISTGYADGTFRWSAAITRQAMAGFLYRMGVGTEAPACTSAPFSDVAVSHPFCGEIAWMADNGIASGYGDGTFRPATTVSRQATAAFLARFSQLPG